MANRSAWRPCADFSTSLFQQLCGDPPINATTTPVPPSARRVGEALLQAAQQANSHILRMIKANHWEKAGATLVAAAIVGDNAVCVNVGDSPMFHLPAGARQLVTVSESHNVAAILMRAKLIAPEMALHHEGNRAWSTTSAGRSFQTASALPSSRSLLAIRSCSAATASAAHSRRRRWARCWRAMRRCRESPPRSWPVRARRAKQTTRPSSSGGEPAHPGYTNAPIAICQQLQSRPSN